MQICHVLGLPRSGTTIFYQCLTRHDKTAYFFSKKFYHLTWLFRPKPLEGYIWKKLNSELDYRTLAKPFEKSQFLSEVKFYCNKLKSDFFISKNPDNVLKIKWLESIHPSKYIVLHREPNATIRSIYHYAEKNLERDLQNKVSYPGSFKGWITILNQFGDGSLSYSAITKYHDFLKKYQIEDARNFPHIDISYEDFTADPQMILNNCFEFLELPRQKIKLPKVITNMNLKYLQDGI